MLSDGADSALSFPATSAVAVVESMDSNAERNIFLAHVPDVHTQAAKKATMKGMRQRRRKGAAEVPE